MFGGSNSDPQVPLTTGSWGTIPSSKPPVPASSGFGTSVPVSSAFGGSTFCPPRNYPQAPLFGNLPTEPFPSAGTFFTPSMRFPALSVYQPPGLDNFTYSGETDVGTFLRKFRDLAARHNWTKENAMLNIQYHLVDAALCSYNAWVQSQAFSQGKDIDLAILDWNLFVRDIKEAFGASTPYAELVRQARSLRYEQSDGALDYYFKMLELLGKMKVQNDKEIVMYLLMGLPHELVKAITLSNINKPVQIRQYLVRYEQLNSLVAQPEQSAEIELASDVQTPVTKNPEEEVVQESIPNVQSWDHSDEDPNSCYPEQFSSPDDPPEGGAGSYDYGDEEYATEQNQGQQLTPAEGQWHSNEYYDDDVDQYH
jgi:hypothetical protein